MNGQAEQTDEAIAAEGESDQEADVEIEAGSDSVAESAQDLDPAIVELQAKADDNWDRYLRAAAELENVRKRASRDVENARKFALERFGKELLAVKDSLELGLHSEDNNVESLLEGSEATLKLLGTAMQQFGIQDIDPVGEPFDPEFHEAISMQASDDAEPGSVLNVVQKGYALNGRLLRPAMVIVAAE